MPNEEMRDFGNHKWNPEKMVWEKIQMENLQELGAKQFERREEDGAILWKGKERIDKVRLPMDGVIFDDHMPKELKKLGIRVDYRNKLLIMDTGRFQREVQVDLERNAFAEAIKFSLENLFPNEFDIELR